MSFEKQFVVIGVVCFIVHRGGVGVYESAQVAFEVRHPKFLGERRRCGSFTYNAVHVGPGFP